jgi:crotonobetainyl-CoA:carnitine CoA-transferase CaiB-like acyl-CoA transferase
MSGPLEGLLVLSLEQAVAAPFCTARLADAGARVIKVERAQGDFARSYDDVVHGESAYFVWLNRGKQSLVADIKAADDAALLRRIVSRADVFVQNLAPGAAARAGFDSARLRALNRRLITCDITGYGKAGPYREMKAYDLLIQCEVGLAAITGGVESPGRVGVSVADICCGMNAYTGILEALLARAITGQGRGIEVSLFDGLAEWMTVPLLHHDYGGRAPARLGIRHPSIAPYGVFAAAEGEQIVLAVQNQREWVSLCANVLESDHLADDPRFRTNALRVANRASLDTIMGSVLATLSRDTLEQRLRNAQIAYANLNSVARLSTHPQLRRMKLEAPTGSLSMPAPPIVTDDDPRARAAVPSLGAHTVAIREEFRS